MTKARSKEELAEIVGHVSKGIKTHAEWAAIHKGYNTAMLSDMLVATQTAFSYTDLEWGVLGMAVDILRGLNQVRQQLEQEQHEREGVLTVA